MSHGVTHPNDLKNAMCADEGMSILTTFLRTEVLLFVAAFLLSFCLPITKYIWKTEVVKLNTFQVYLRSDPKGESPFSSVQ